MSTAVLDRGLYGVSLTPGKNFSSGLTRAPTCPAWAPLWKSKTRDAHTLVTVTPSL